MPCKVLSEIAMLWNKWPINFSALPALQNAEWMMMMIDLLKEKWSPIILPVQAPFDKPYHEEYVAFNLIF
ncbi:hypothetical protein T4D_12025 [Trichinella pseudospiralis]|uniref:Uncharacterized protein n=1 Tax=Trichinella pseudospiralis TaxID=6337 RepID=A0A0V1FX92_TRIPS|nr:hypothetical protein T4D_1130 [Trichinella pseudospiralis]KRY90572.1 hypothetical protein T4D_12025 [Trichinella pseudospiralis]